MPSATGTNSNLSPVVDSCLIRVDRIGVGGVSHAATIDCSQVSAGLRLIHYGRLLPSREVRDAWAAHEVHDSYPTMREVRTLCDGILPGAIKQHLLWRYSVIWQKSGTL